MPGLLSILGIIEAIWDLPAGFPWAIIATMIAGVIGSVSPFALYRYYRRPQPVTGVLPWDQMSDGIQDLNALGMETPEDEINFMQEAFAHRLTDPKALNNDTRFRENTRKFRAKEGEIVVPLFVQNRGQRNMQDYKLTVTFNEEGLPNDQKHQTRILNVHTETLAIDGLFCEREHFRGGSFEKLPNEKLVQMYQDIGLPGHFVSFTGSLGSGTFESIILELEVQPTVDHLYLIVEIDSPALFVGEKMFCQRVAVDRGNGAA
jgi:hypothetical protein